MAEEKVLLTAKGLEDAKERLEWLKTVRRPEVIEKLKIAKGFGDLSENSEYDEAKDDQAKTEAEIAQLEDMISHAEIIEADTESVSIGSIVRVRDMDTKAENEWHIVGPTEVNLAEKKISYESPIGGGLLGAKPGKTVKILVPSGKEVKLKILSISK